jgi:hypothetical protein
MNRLKLWLYMLVVLGAGAANIYLITLEGAARSMASVDAALQSAASAHRSRERLLSGQATAVAALAARDPALLEALAPQAPPSKKKKEKEKPEAATEAPGADPAERTAAAEAASAAAVGRAASALAVPLPAAAFWAVATQERLAEAPAAEEGPQRDVSAFLKAAAGGEPHRGYARVNDALWYGAAVPAGGGALVLFLPVDATWATALQTEAGCDVTLAAGTPQLISTAKPDQARQVLVVASASPGRMVGKGELGPLQLESPIRVEAPLLFARPPAVRALAVELAGLPKSYVVLSMATAPAFTALAHYQWVAVEVLAGLLLIGLLLGVLVKTEVLAVPPSWWPWRRTSAATSPRAPPSPRARHAGRALKRRQVAQVAQAPAAHVDPFAAPPPEAAEPPEPHFDFSRPPAPAGREPLAPPRATATDPFGAPPPAPFAAEPPAAPEPQEITQRLDGAKEPPAPPPAPPPASAFAAESFSARPVPRAPVAPPVTAAGMTAVGIPAMTAPGMTAVGVPAMTMPGLTAVGMPSVTAPAAATGAEEDEETHWRAVHAEFLEVRARCGESVENLSFERFRPKLEKNRETLLQKYGCCTVRFQVYVKEGKAALRRRRSGSAPGRHRQPQREGGAAARRRGELQPAAVLLGDPLGDGQAEPGAALLGGDVGLEDARQQVGRAARRRPPRRAPRHRLPGREAQRPPAGHRLQGVLHQVVQHLEHLVAIGQHRREAGGDLPGERHARRVGGEEPQQPLRQLGGRHPLQGRGGQPGEAGELVHDAPQAAHLLADGAGRLLQDLGEVGPLAGVPQQLHAQSDGGQRVLELVGQRPGHLPPGRHPLRGGQAGAQKLAAIRRLSALAVLIAAGSRPGSGPGWTSSPPPTERWWPPARPVPGRGGDRHLHGGRARRRAHRHLGRCRPAARQRPAAAPSSSPARRGPAWPRRRRAA